MKNNRPRTSVSKPKTKEAKKWSILVEDVVRVQHFAYVSDTAINDEDWVQLRYKNPPKCTDLLDLIESRIQKFTDNSFVYLRYTAPRSSIYYSPYALIESPYAKVNKSEFYTFSRHGVTYWSDAENHFTKLPVWVEEYKVYLGMMKLKIFKKYRLWKSFTVWRKAIVWTKFAKTREFFENNLYFLSPALAEAAMLFRDEYNLFLIDSFVDPTATQDLTISNYIERQEYARENAEERIRSFRSRMTEMLYNACNTALEQKGFVPGDESLIPHSIKKPLPKMSYIDRAKKRRYCNLMSHFINLCDYLTVTFLHAMLHNSYHMLASVFRIHDELGPTEKHLENKSIYIQIEPPRPPDKYQMPLITGELTLQTDFVIIEPIEDIVKKSVMKFIESLTKCVFDVSAFHDDDIFIRVTEPTIMGRKEDRFIVPKPSLAFRISINPMIEINKATVKAAITTAYKKCEIYIERFEELRIDYEEDVEMDRKMITGEKDLDILRSFCERYNAELKRTEGIVPNIYLGLLKFNQYTFGQKIRPICKELLEILHIHIPSIANYEVQRIFVKAKEVMKNLSAEPETTLQYVDYLHYIDNCHEEIAVLITEIDYAYNCFMLIKDFDIFVDPDDKEEFMDCEDLILESKEVLLLKRDKRQQFINSLDICLQKDIKELFIGANEVKQDVVQPWLIDIESDITEVKKYLQVLYDKISNLQAIGLTYRGYQREFKIDLSRFQDLDLTFQMVKYKQQLWDSLELWTDSLRTWKYQQFSTLVMADLSDVTENILKNCAFLEKNLPTNKIIPMLRSDASDFKKKLGIIDALRRPGMKTRHWMAVEQITGLDILSNPLISLSEFETADIYGDQMGEAIIEVSNQANNEASLEILLKKVEEAWDGFELIVIPHRDSTDVFILGGTEELQILIDESNININTIAASRYVGPIKNVIDDWLQKLELISDTLEQWMTCQVSWIYLEAIFSAPDIQRQLPNEAKMFLTVDRNWKELMRACFKMPLAFQIMVNPQVLETMLLNNDLLDKITKCLEAYLEVKRIAFPRFFFLSNDELLEILAQTRNPHAVQPHLRKCFDAIARLEFGYKEGPDGPIQTTDIIAMLSPEGEKITFGRGLKARGPVEDWLGKVEAAMFSSLKRYMKLALTCYSVKDRSEWFQEHPNQVVLTVSQQQWATDVHVILDNENKSNVNANMIKFKAKLQSDLTRLAQIARTDISSLLRKVLCALITVDVHNLDTISNLCNKNVDKSSDFDWLKMLRYYWLPLEELMVTRMSSGSLPYFYEYLGAGGVLVITPLTDRCYLCLMGALQMDLGGAPAGPAGTGKTETTKDLAKAMAKQCVVFNCSEGLDFKMMARFFSGLATSGAWCCFDEFNRIDIEVLSVIAQQLITIRNAKAKRQQRFFFEGREIKLNMSCAVFITMNPGYAGRTELPDNLKALFRPIAMMVPDYALIAEVILYSEGFEASKVLAKKMVQMYKHCSEQLSQQDHYDFGMRAVKSVLVRAGALKRDSPNQREDITLIVALKDSNVPKFLADDVILFNGILGDLFPGVDLPVVDYGLLQEAVEFCMIKKKLQPVPDLVAKTIQLFETMCVRWGVMLVGPTGGGKSCVLNTLACALTKMWKDGIVSPYYRNVRIQTLNPKAVTLDELYGAVNLATMEWTDGLLGLAVRSAVNVTEEEHQWVVNDGPVDAVWIENLNTVLDDNKMLCLANSERIKLTEWVHMVFEVADLAQASPATVSRCGMVYVDPSELKWMPLVLSWKDTIEEKRFAPKLMEYLIGLFERHFDKFLVFTRRKCRVLIDQVDVSKVDMMITLVRRLILMTSALNGLEDDIAKGYILKLFTWATLWSVGGNIIDESRASLEQFVLEQLSTEKGYTTSEHSIWDLRLDVTELEWDKWDSIVEPFLFNIDTPFFEMLVPTMDTVKYGYLSELLFREEHPVMFTGDTGVGKTILATAVLKKLADMKTYIPVTLSFSAQTSSIRTQLMIEARLDKRKRTLLGPPIDKKMVLFVDDVNMPKLDTYGSQPPIELLRQILDYKGLFDREKLFWKGIVDVVLGCGCAPPGGGRNPLTPRFVRHFALLLLSPPNRKTLTTIFSAIIKGFFDEFCAAIKPIAGAVVNAAVDLYWRISEELLPTPVKSHYVFNLRDLAKCAQGILQADPSCYSVPKEIERLFYHEAERVFHDRLINTEDKTYFKSLMNNICIKYFANPIVQPKETLFFGDFMIFGQDRADRYYEEIKDVTKLTSIIYDYLEDYNGLTGKAMKLILFQDAIEHVTRLARLLRTARGNGLLVGLSGMGKQSLSRLGAHMNGYKCKQIELTRSYDYAAFHEDIRAIYWQAGVLNTSTVFLMTDTQIIKEEFLEDINNILNSGEVPGLYEADEYENVLLAMRDQCAAAKQPDCSRDGIFTFFISRVRANLHIVLCMSPIGDAFRRRCRMFPSLVNCCTIDWFVKWPQEALYSVALGSLTDKSDNEEQCQSMAKICVTIHESVEKASDDFLAETRRHYYTTPSSYLELLKLYHSLVEKRTEILIAKRSRIANGLSKILETNEVVAVMGEELALLQPKLEAQSAIMQQLVTQLDNDQKAADIVKQNVQRDEVEAQAKAVVTQALADEAAADLEVAMPALRAAQDALNSISKSDINEMKSFITPPKLVQFVMESVCILFGVKPSWDSAKKIMADVNFLKKLIEFDKENIQEATIKKIKVYIDDKDFDPAKIEKVSKVAKSVCLWVIAMEKFSQVYKVVEPKIKAQREAERGLKEVMKVLKQKQAELAAVEAKLQELSDALAIKNSEFKVIQDEVDLTNGRLNRAGRLTSALSDEEVRWGITVETLTKELWAIPGDVLAAGACVAYLGAFTTVFRRDLCAMWVKECQKYKIPSSKVFNLIEVLGDAYEIRNWNMNFLPRDEVSTENGIIVTKALRWPLMIDPQEQANRWIRSFEGPNDLKIIKMTDPNLIRILEICIRQGFPMLIEELDETIDPTLDPVLKRLTYVTGGRLLIRLGDTDVDYDNNFRLYMTTKLSNPHYLPEVCVTVTLVNFLVTASGLEDQLLADVVAIELPVMEKQRSDLIVQINNDRQQLLMLEDKILKLLYASKGNILDDEELVETLNESKETSAIIAARLIDTEKTEAVISKTREQYRILAQRGAILFFVVASLADIDPMYQYSLKYFTAVFRTVIEAEHPPLELKARLEQLLSDEVFAIYLNVSRGLFEKHKMIFSFLLAVAVEKQKGIITDKEFVFLVRGPVGVQPKMKAKPANLELSDNEFHLCLCLEQSFNAFTGLTEFLQFKIQLTIDDVVEDLDFMPSSPKIATDYNNKLNLFQKLILINAVKNHKLVAAIGGYVRKTLGKKFTEGHGSTLASLYQDTDNVTPLIFILSTGSDPMAAFQRFAEEMKFTDKLTSISLGQGQGPAAEALIEKGRTNGEWIYLQNCHLATSWMKNMEEIIKKLALGTLAAHIDFRLYLSSMPSTTFPVSVLQNSVKVTNEPPKGIKANMMRSLDDLSEDYFEKHALGNDWRSMVFGVCMFHGVILERRKFGPLGWNITYEFNESDRESGLRTLDMYCNREEVVPIPWEALYYINGEITWGGRVTDYWDQRCLSTILKVFSSPQILTEGYAYCESGVYRSPVAEKLPAFKEYVNQLPFIDHPDIFGMHENANLVFQRNEATFFLSTLLAGMPKEAGSEGADSTDDIVLRQITDIENSLAVKILTDNPFPKLVELDSKGRMPSLSTVLFQETERFNKYLRIIHATLKDLRKAIKGLVVMSEALEGVYQAFINNQVPDMWSAKGYLSTKSLGKWVYDFQIRIDYVQNWMDKGLPKSSWISGLFFPQSFLTGLLQTHARRTNIPIDDLKIDFEVTTHQVDQDTIYRNRGSNKIDGFDGVEPPEIGIIIHGLYIEAARWDAAQGGLVDAFLGELTPSLPALYLKPCTKLDIGTRYQSPLYKTQVRAGVLSTTGHSTNFVLTVLLKSAKEPDFWILRGTALVTLITE